MRDLDPRLSAITGHFIMRAADAQIAEMYARYDYGYALHVAHYSNDPALGRHVFEGAAERLSVHPTLLRTMARVAENIPPPEFHELVSQRLRTLLPPTWAHVTALAHVRPHARHPLAVEMVRDSLSVRELAERARALRSGR